MLWRWALRELRRSWKISSFFVLNLSLGLTGFIALEAYKAALQNHVEENRLEILGADIAVSARRELTDAEMASVRAELPPASPESQVYEFFAMTAAPSGSRLAQVKAIDALYPLYGELKNDRGEAIRIQPGEAWLDPELAPALAVEPGARIKLGKLDLEVKGFIGNDSTRTFRSAGIAPRILIDRSQIAASGLIQFGSTFSQTFLFRLPPATDADELQSRLYKKITDPAVSVDTARDEAQGAGAQLKRLSDFLGLVALVALFLAALGAAYVWRLFLQQRVKDVAILRSLGLAGDRAVLLYVIEASILGVMSLVPALIAAQLLFPFLNGLLSNLTPFELRPLLNGRSILVGFILSLATSLLIALPFLLRLREVRPSQLFSEEKFNPSVDLRRPWALLPAVAVFWGLSVLQAQSFKVGSLFMGALLAVLVVLAGGGWLCLRAIAGVRGGPWALREGLRSAGRRRGASLSIFIALGLGSLLMNILPQIKSAMQRELDFGGTESKLPSLFMFDIQDEQLEGLKALLREKNVEMANLSPLIRSRFLKINGADYERAAGASTVFRTREEENDARFRNRGVNLSFRTSLSDSEDLVGGAPITGAWDAASGKLPALSVEERYAGRVGLKIGDRVVFDVQGVEIEGEVVNLRKVRWTSFQPNFFVLIQPGVLDDAPKTWIAGLPRMDQALKDELQRDISARFGNVSVVDVNRTVTDVMKVADQMSWSLELMAALALFTGAMVLASIARSQVRSRRWELNLLKVLGASPGRVKAYLLAEFTVLAGLSSLLGSVLSLAVSWALMWQIFGGGYAVDIGWIFGISAFVTALGLLIAERSSASVVREKPMNLLHGGD